MKKEENNIDLDEIEENYDFDYSKAKPNRFAADLFKQDGVIVLNKQLRSIFPDSESVNNALIEYLRERPNGIMKANMNQ